MLTEPTAVPGLPCLGRKKRKKEPLELGDNPEPLAFFRKALDEFFNKRDIAPADRNYAPDYVQHNEDVAGMARKMGLSAVEGMKRFFNGFFEAFPDYHVEVEYLSAEGDKVFAICNWEGTHQGRSWARRPPARRSR